MTGSGAELRKNGNDTAVVPPRMRLDLLGAIAGINGFWRDELCPGLKRR